LRIYTGQTLSGLGILAILRTPHLVRELLNFFEEKSASSLKKNQPDHGKRRLVSSRLHIRSGTLNQGTRPCWTAFAWRVRQWI